MKGRVLEAGADGPADYIIQSACLQFFWLSCDVCVCVVVPGQAYGAVTVLIDLS